MKPSQVLAATLLPLSGSVQATCTPPTMTDREVVIDTVLAFTQSLDDNSESLMRSVTTPDVVFDGTAFIDLGMSGPEPLVGQDNVVLILNAVSMATTHHLSNFRVNLDDDNANFTAYAQAYHYKELEQPRENPNNHYLMGNRYEGRVVKADGDWKLAHFIVRPVWQSGNFAVMGLGGQ